MTSARDAVTRRQEPVLLGRFEVESPEWHAARTEGLGGSEIAAVLGLSKWESRFSLWHRKAGQIGEQTVNPAMEWGSRLEPVVLAKWAEEHPDHTAVPAGTYCHAERPWQIANPDLIADSTTGEQVLVEAKTALYGDEWGAAGTDEVPPYYLCQVRWYLDVLGLDRAYLVVLIGGHDYREYVIEQNQADVELMRREARAFLDSLPTGPAPARPDVDAHSSTYEAVKALHPDIEPVDVELDAELARQFCQARAVLERAKADAQLATSRVADALGNGRRARFLDQTIATRQVKGEGTPYLVAGRHLPTFDDEQETSAA